MTDNNNKQKLAIITGANSGIGKETALGLAKSDFKVILACRNLDKGEQAKEYIVKNSNNNNIVVEQLDLADLANVRDFAKRINSSIKTIDVLINNAGGIFNTLGYTKDGIEQTFGINHLGHFYLTRLLLETILASAPSRIINISSFGHFSANGIQLNDINYEKTGYRGFKAYSQSKLANIYFTKYLASKLNPNETTVNALHPGAVRSGFGMDGDLKGLYGEFNKLIRVFEIPSSSGAKTPIYLATSDKVDKVTGQYFSRKRKGLLSPKANSEKDARELWEFSEKLLAEKGFEVPPLN